MRRALRWDGVMPVKVNAEGAFMEMLTPDEVELYFQNRSAEASQLHMFDQPSSPETWERIWSDVEAS